MNAKILSARQATTRRAPTSRTGMITSILLIMLAAMVIMDLSTRRRAAAAGPLRRDVSPHRAVAKMLRHHRLLLRSRF
jgi:hypothetical protein